MQERRSIDDTRLGAILLENPMMREEDLERCLQIQALTGQSRPLGRVLVEEGLITEPELEHLLELQARRRRMIQGVSLVEGADPDAYLRSAVECGASDVYLSEGRPVMVRVAGSLQPLSEESLAPPEIWQFVRDHLGHDALDILAGERSLGQEFDHPEFGRGRLRAFRHLDGIGVHVRIHPSKVRDVKAANLPNAVVEAVRAGRGLVLIGSQARGGLSETLSTLTRELVALEGRMVVVLDDSLEAPMPEGPAVVVRRRVGEHVADTATGLRAALALCADAIVAADVSTPESFEIALRAAESGCLVVAGMPARGALDALDRVLSYYPEQDLGRVRIALSSVLRCVLTVQLMPDSDRRGEVLATELLTMDEKVQAVVRDGHLAQIPLLLRLDAGDCGRSLDECLLELIGDGKVRFEDVFAYGDDKARLLRSALAASKAVS
jgi:twitching motility protein PilT